LGITVSVVQVRGQLVKLGINAPASVQIVRQELLGEHPEKPPGKPRGDEADHRRRNELNLLHLRLEAIQRRIDRGEKLNAETTLYSLLNKVASIDHEWNGARPQAWPTTKGRPIRLLVVEDCDNERQLMAYVLASHGFDIQVARDGSEAIEQLQMWDWMPDFVLMDMNMPVADGQETLLKIRHDDRLSNLKVFAVTGSRRDIGSEPAGRGWDGWFQKPLNVPNLIESLQNESSPDSVTIAT
jgi:CheY-like chemotaxis protein